MRGARGIDDEQLQEDLKDYHDSKMEEDLGWGSHERMTWADACEDMPNDPNHAQLYDNDTAASWCTRRS